MKHQRHWTHPGNSPQALYGYVDREDKLEEVQSAHNADIDVMQAQLDDKDRRIHSLDQRLDERARLNAKQEQLIADLTKERDDAMFGRLSIDSITVGGKVMPLVPPLTVDQRERLVIELRNPAPVEPERVTRAEILRSTAADEAKRHKLGGIPFYEIVKAIIEESRK